MPTRRVFLQTVGAGGVGALTSAFIGARGREHSIWSALEAPLFAAEPGTIILSSNENPLGPHKTVIDAVRAAFGPTGAQPGRYAVAAGNNLIEAIAKKFGVTKDNVVLGCGSTQILRSATHLFTAKDRPLVATIPTYEECAGYAEMMGHPIRGVSLDADFKMDLEKMAAAAKGAGLVFFCNPNNPTATYIPVEEARDFFATVNRESPETTILIDEAYFDYVSGPRHETHMPLAVENPRILVARTFSKAYGMAGLRMGYAIGHKDTIKRMAEWDGGSGGTSLNVFALHAGMAAIGLDPQIIAQERARNTAVRALVMKWFADRGLKTTDSQTNFLFVNTGRPAKEFREACKAKGVLVARDFPPFEKTHCRISIGTMEEMQKAMTVFSEVLAQTSSATFALPYGSPQKLSSISLVKC